MTYPPFWTTPVIYSNHWKGRMLTYKKPTQLELHLTFEPIAVGAAKALEKLTNKIAEKQPVKFGSAGTEVAKCRDFKPLPLPSINPPGVRAELLKFNAQLTKVDKDGL
jgi:hypothetical protein